MILLAEARTDCERRVIDEWAAVHHPGARVQPLAQTDLERLPDRKSVV